MSKTHTRVMQQTGIDASSYRVSNDIAYNIMLDLIQAIKHDATDLEKTLEFREHMRLLLLSLDDELGRAVHYVQKFNDEQEAGKEEAA